MKKIFIAIVGMLVAGSAFADLEVAKMTITGVTTNASEASFDTQDSVKRVTGKIKAIHVDVSASSNIDIDIVAQSAVGSAAVTLLSLDDVTADASYYPMAQAQTTAGASITNQGTELVALKQTIRLSAGDSDAASKDVTVYVIYEE